jgi:hypothetical protein
VTSEVLPFPVSPDEVTVGWLSAQLRSSGMVDSGPTLKSVSWAPLGVGAGFMGAVVRLTLGWSPGADGATGPTSLVAKFAAADPVMRETVRGYRNYEREVGFFRALAGELATYVPACHAAEFDGPSNCFVLVLDDLAPAFRDGDQVAGCDLDQARACLDVQLDLHARYWGRVDGHPELDWVPRVDGDWFVPSMTNAFPIGWAGVSQRFPELIPAGLTALGVGFAARLAELMGRLGRCPQTLVHSDFRLDNIMFARDAAAPSVKVLDWQGILISAGVHDVAFLLSQNLDPGLRRGHERDLIGYYHQGLVARGVGDYPLEQVWADYRLAVLFEWVYAVVIGGSLPMSDDRSAALFAAMVQRSGAAIEDLDALELLAPDQAS